MEKVCIGVDVGGTNLRCAIVTPEGAVLRRERLATDAASGSAAFVSQLLLVLDRLKREAEACGMRIAAAGLGVPGLISSEGTVLASINLRMLQGVNLSRVISSRLRLPVLVMNDANAGAVGEFRFGAGRGYRSSLMLTIGTGVGAGLVLDGKLWTGMDGAAGEFGHMTVEPGGRPCCCGNRGCLEQYVSATAIAACAGGNSRGGEGGAADVAARALQGDPEAAGIFEQAGSYLGIAAAGVLNLLNLEAIILGGGVAQCFDLLAAPMRREISARALAIPGARGRIIEGELGGDAGVIGAAATAFDAVELNLSRSSAQFNALS